MNTTENKISAIISAITEDIDRHEKKANDAMLTLEQMNTSVETFRETCRTFSRNIFVVGYLKRIKKRIEHCDLKSAENLIRFHAHYQRTKGHINDGSGVSLGQRTVMMYLENYTEQFFD